MTGDLASVNKTGKNTGWATGASPADNQVPKFSARKAYVQQHHADHPLAQSLLGRHTGAASDTESKRGLSCAEGHSLLQAHKEMMTQGRVHARDQLETFKESLIPTPAQPTFTSNTKRARKNQMMNAWERRKEERESQLNALAKSMTGMDSWESYSAREASFMAWNDIQQHGQLSHIRHDPQSDIKPGQTMAPCEQCRHDIVAKLKKPVA